MPINFCTPRAGQYCGPEPQFAPRLARHATNHFWRLRRGGIDRTGGRPRCRRKAAALRAYAASHGLGRRALVELADGLGLMPGRLPILARRKPGRGLELAGEGAVISVAALQRNIGNRQVGVQQAVRVFEAHFLDHLPWRQVEHPLAVTLQLRD